ncbi:MAG: TIGR03936 family radical SAM-associated protein [Bacillota bacterium]
MPRYRIRYSKEGTARFVSHLDMIRTFERAVRRAGLPVSLTEGFNPHPRFSFGFPLPVGMAGLEEYVDIDLEEAVPDENIVASLDKVMPPGLRITGARPVEGGGKSLMAESERSSCLAVIEEESLTGDFEKLQKCIEEIMHLKELIVSRRKKEGGSVPFDIRPGILMLSARNDGSGVIVLEMEIMTGSSLNVRPQEVIEAIAGCGALKKDCHIDITRTGITGRGGKELF